MANLRIERRRIQRRERFTTKVRSVATRRLPIDRRVIRVRIRLGHGEAVLAKAVVNTRSVQSAVDTGGSLPSRPALAFVRSLEALLVLVT